MVLFTDFVFERRDSVLFNPTADTTPSTLKSNRDNTLPQQPLHHPGSPHNQYKMSFIEECEFVQMLANPAYLSCIIFVCLSHNILVVLLQSGYFDDGEFISYLSILKTTWSRPDYSQYIMYPNGLYMLHLLTVNDSFIKYLKQTPNAVDFLHKQQYYNWLAKTDQ